MNAQTQRIDAGVTPTGREHTLRLYQFDAIIDLMLAEPRLYHKQIAERLGRTPAWISYIVNSDSFKAIYEQRRSMTNAAVSLAITGELQKIAIASLSELAQRIENNPAKFSDKGLLEVTDSTLQRLGYGVALPGSAPPGVTVFAGNGAQVAIASASREDLLRAQEQIRAREGASLPRLIEGTILPEPEMKEDEATVLRQAMKAELAQMVNVTWDDVKRNRETGKGVLK